MTYFADCATSIVERIIANELIAKDTRRLRIHATHMAAAVVPGQFFMIRNPASDDPLIGRAFALYDVDPSPSSQHASEGVSGWVDVVYLVKGKLTSSLAKLVAGDEVALWGPLGNGFPARPVDHLVMVAGGIGQTPFLTLAREALGIQSFGEQGTRQSGYAQKVSFCYGVRSAEYFAGIEQFESSGCELHLATEDGSLGPARRVTSVLEQVLDQHTAGTIRIVCCGPEPMMEAVAEIARIRNLPCEVSLETPMACGIGICFSCVAKLGTPDDWDYKRTCVEGPVFDSREILWH